MFDVTLDCEDGAPVGLEREHAKLVAQLAREAKPGARVAARVHTVDHAAFEYDSNRRQATASRKRLLAQASARGEWVAGAHLPFPGIGHVGKAAAGQGSYRWIAAEFGPTAAPAKP